MSQPVTTNPIIIMFINMTVVFLVLIALGIVINLIHVFDPTRSKEKPAEPKQEAPAPATVPAPAPEPMAETAGGVTPEIVAVIAAALSSYGYGSGAIHAIRPLQRENWKQSGRTSGTNRTA